MYNNIVYDNVTEGRKKVAKNFTVAEFASKDGSRVVIINPLLPEYLQKARDHFGKPMIITSGYRTTAHNIKQGGVGNSNHVFGNAADVYINGVPVIDLYNYFCEIAGNSCEIGIYNSFVHFAVQDKKSRFDSRTK